MVIEIMSLLPQILSSKHQAQRPLVLLQSSIAQSTLPLLRYLIRQASTHTILCSFLYPSSSLVNESGAVHVLDFTSHVSGYCETRQSDIHASIISAVQHASAGGLNVIIDSVDTLCSDASSISDAYAFLKDLMIVLRQRPASSTLILHVVSPSPILRLLTQTAFSSQLTHLIAHPTVLLKHLNSAYFTPPPPASPASKFWTVFIPISERNSESDHLVFGLDGEGPGHPADFVVEVIIRGGGDLVGRRKAVERVLEGWSSMRNGPCSLKDLQELAGVWPKGDLATVQSDPTQNLSFNLNLTPQQQESRAQVPLPYAHEGKPVGAPVSSPGAIYYDPDSADDLDDDDPDEDLDI